MRLNCEWLHLVTIGILYFISKQTVACLDIILKGFGKQLLYKTILVLLLLIPLYYWFSDRLINFLDRVKKM